MPIIASLGGVKIHPASFTNRPIFACATTDDQLYPSAIVEKFIEPLRKAGADIEFKVFEGFGHTFGYAESIAPDFASFYAKTRRDYWRNRIRWSAADTALGRCDWLRVTELGRTRTSSSFDDFPVTLQSPVRLGVEADTRFEGPGLKIGAVASGSNAEKAGLKAGDIILTVAGVDADDRTKLMETLDGWESGNEAEIVVKRGDETLTLKVAMVAAPPRVFFGADPGMGHVSAAVEANVFDIRTRNVAKLTLCLAPELVDLTKPVAVRVNGSQVFSGMVVPSLETLAATYAADRDPIAAAVAVIEIEVP
jgi:hypothetical protein